MTLRQLIDELELIAKVHPEAEDATVWADSEQFGQRFQIKTVGWDKRRKPARLKLED